MVSQSPATVLLALAMGLIAPGIGEAREVEEAAPADSEAVGAVRQALRGQRFPWYDATADDFRPVMPPRMRSSTGSGWWNWDLGEVSPRELGQLIIFLLLAASLTALVLFIARTWQRRLPNQERPTTGKPAQVTGTTTRIGALPTALEVDEADPLEAARQLRERGDRSRAVVLLFAHQLLVLDRLGKIRLAPGRTGRQLVRSIEEAELREPLSRSLRLFEDVYYGHREPDPAAFEALWAEAEEVDRRLGSGGRP
ncbi:DUF4129 domain-containing protein [Tautonia sociabilis]|uniref:DUF4129 domain-containing protein n=1 Tax=Tautonia sociabilis TaxID=2080755 RepID=A0A432MGU7_9BACT|nr:DUF4129 domain-containing protein [Tautonia sociabilis]RUL86169.1 DUF4129 domain-containing protein [Tautonia sociabilis]